MDSDCRSLLSRCTVTATLVLSACQPAPTRPLGAGRQIGTLALADWRATNSVGLAGASLFGHITGTAPDTLLSVRSTEAARVTLHITSTDGTMHGADAFAFSAGEKILLRDRGSHAMLEGLARKLSPGDSLDIVLHFAKAGDVVLRVPVFRLTEAATELP